MGGEARDTERISENDGILKRLDQEIVLTYKAINSYPFDFEHEQHSPEFDTT